ncbi:hypothetical protein BASA50_009719 [Batrachochytrium salamandrivorans]|uniref:Signal recognition particle subunit SRP14 n=1 Tax=Batrachochytrium salamandrivorans TaxID=1357716 RepID=A0ABQ8F3U5_9FUNG|nr:hypothetical protein BASA62_004646 [Batrachochytrium salamandrivorans]KAH6570998.1 hypothetical protein BASA60_007427 [Batrachochytrium salamandrivorans]KAH6590017.1 hypothetical protein BASA50_009719 [Batrachochytrium salamandrivorans]KAH6592298.1 hypothetical protein BASA61_004621 [Batrachochytrium salamandrivorans]KAH9270110.1 hypothetical protein BASA83_007785 [Batrachochytrium salamandrivorans]
MKRYSHTQTKQAKKSSEAMDLLHSTDTQFCSIVRATLGNHKISTLVEPSNLISFTDAYTAITRLHMDSLKRKDRKDKKNRSKAKKSGSSEPANESTTNV